MAVRGLIELKGAKELDRKLRELDKKVARKLSRHALRIGAKLIQAEAKQRVPVLTGALKKSIKVRAGRRRKGRISMRVVTGQDDFKGDQFYGPMVELGHFAGSRKLADRKFVPAHPFMRPAYEAKKEAAVKVVIDDLRDGIEREAKS